MSRIMLCCAVGLQFGLQNSSPSYVRLESKGGRTRHELHVCFMRGRRLSSANDWNGGHMHDRQCPIGAESVLGPAPCRCCAVLSAASRSSSTSRRTSTNPAKEIFRALAPGQATVPQPLLLSISSPFSKEGVFYETHAKHHGDNDSPILCWQAPSKLMNPTLPQEVIDQ